MMETLKRCLAVTAGIMSVGLAQATTYYVSSGGSDDASGTSRDTPFATIGKAVEAANADETAEAVVLLSDLTSAATVEITGAYTLKGDTADPAATTLSASGTVSPLVKVSNAGAVVEYLTISGGTGAEKSATGGNVFLNGGGTVRYCRLVNAKGKFVYGGGAVNNNGTISHCEISGCFSDGDASSDYNGARGIGLYQFGADAKTEDSLICSNSADDKGALGGGIYAAGGVVTGCVVSNNIVLAVTDSGPAKGCGAGVYLDGVVQLEKCLVARNRGGVYGAGFSINSADAVVDHCTIVENIIRSTTGAGVWSPTSIKPKVTNTIAYNNRSAQKAGVGSFYVGGYDNFSKVLAQSNVGADGLTGNPAFMDAAHDDWRITAYSVGARAATDGSDVGYAQLPDVLTAGIEEFDNNQFPLSEGGKNLHGKCINAVGTPYYRWRIDNLTTGQTGVWTEYRTTYTEYYILLKTAGLYAYNLQAKDDNGVSEVFTRVVRICAPTTYLVPAGTAGNTPTAPYDTLETAANDIFTALEWSCTKGANKKIGTTLIVAPGDYGVTRTVNVTTGVKVLGAGPDKTSVYRIGQYKKGPSLQVMQIDHSDALVAGLAITNGYFEKKIDCCLGCNLSLYNGAVSNCVLAKASFPGADKGFVSAAVSVVSGKVYDSVIRENEGGGYNGCGVFVTESGTLSGCVISNNVYNGNYGLKGGGLCVGNGATISRCVICDNVNRKGSGGGYGGGVYAEAGNFDNCLIARNTSGGMGGGGVFVKGGKTVTFKNCTIVKNTASSTGKGGGILAEASAVVNLTNCILIGNEAGTDDATGGKDWSGLTAANCTRLCLDKDFGANPLVVADISKVGFRNPDKNWRTVKGSLCVDVGVDVGYTSKDLDLLGRTRVFNDIIDVGCYEYAPLQGLILFLK